MLSATRGLWLLTAVLTLSIAGKADAQRARVKPKVVSFDFRGHRMGDERWDLRCSPISSETGRNEQTCEDSDGHVAAATARVFYHFADNRLIRVMLAYDPAEYEEIVVAFSEKFGRPHRVTRVARQNRMGATVSDETSLWRTDNGLLLVSRYGDTMNEGLAHITAADEVNRIERQKAEQRKQHRP